MINKVTINYKNKDIIFIRPTSRKFKKNEHTQSFKNITKKESAIVKKYTRFEITTLIGKKLLIEQTKYNYLKFCLKSRETWDWICSLKILFYLNLI